MTKKLFSENVQEEQTMETPASEVVVEEGPKVKQMVRWISNGINETGDSVFTVDAELTSYLEKGYTLLATHYIGTDPAAGIGVFYVLVHE